MSEPLDLLWGATEIAKAIQATPRKTFELLERGDIPARKVRGRWVASRAQLQAFFLHPHVASMSHRDAGSAAE